MPVRDAGPYLEASIRSILEQTFTDFEFIVRDDGSVDGSTETLRQWAERDPRIKLFVGDRPLGPAESSNWVVRQASAPFIARMDADDISHPDRLRRQLAVLEADPGACLVGTLWEGIDPGGRRVRPRDRWRLSRRGPFAPFPHGSIMFRREAFDAIGGYRGECNFWEDADLYQRMGTVGRLMVLPEALYQHRSSGHSTRVVSPSDWVEDQVDRMYRTLEGRPRDESAEPSSSSAKILPKVFLSLGSTYLWAGERPGVLRRLWRRSELGLDRESVAVLAWALWGSVSPRTLRQALRTLIRVRDFSVRKHYRDGVAYQWHPTFHAPEPAVPQDSSGRAG
jgi:glycosyltransferase involved in cell wall biosynthesis